MTKPSTNQRRDLGIAQDGQGRVPSIKGSNKEVGEVVYRGGKEGAGRQQPEHPLANQKRGDDLDNFSAWDAMG